jgi:signal transduction histidine kinase
LRVGLSEEVGLNESWVPDKKGSEIFRPRARVIRTLGRDLIQNPYVAVQELVKNAYDADAHQVNLMMDGPFVKGEGSLRVEDDGEGMPLEVVQSAWMQPATIYKKRQIRTRGGRRVTGEKGIGRFASARIAQRLELDSVSHANGRRIVARFNWGDFDAEDRFLDEVKSEWEEGPAPPGRGPGTILRLSQFNDDWDGDVFRALRVALSTLLPPTGPGEDFRIELQINDPAGKPLSGPVTRPAILERPRYRLAGRMESDGTASGFFEFEGSQERFTESDKTPVKVVIEREDEEDRPPTCGPFDFDFRVWDRDRDSMAEIAAALGGSSAEAGSVLDAIGGIQVYRDRFRVMMQDRDWLGLDLRRVQNPSMRLSNNQIVGHVLINSDQNLGLVDQSNRQALVDSPELDDFREAIGFLIERLETFRSIRKHPPDRPTPRGGIYDKLRLTSVKDYIESSPQADQKLKAAFQEDQERLKEGLEDVHKAVSRYRRLATLGTLVDVILHEGRNPLAAISGALELVQGQIGTSLSATRVRELNRRLDTISHQTQNLLRLFERISPFSGRARMRREEGEIERVIRAAYEILEKRAEREGVKVSIPETHHTIQMDIADMEALFLNLFDNALYWLTKVEKKDRRIVVQVSRDGGPLRVVFSDSGPGVPEEAAQRIWEPWFSTRGGTGLGLTIAGEVANEHDADLELNLENKGPLSGATFMLTFRDTDASG